MQRLDRLADALDVAGVVRERPVNLGKDAAGKTTSANSVVSVSNSS